MCMARERAVVVVVGGQRVVVDRQLVLKKRAWMDTLAMQDIWPTLQCMHSEKRCMWLRTRGCDDVHVGTGAPPNVTQRG